MALSLRPDTAGPPAKPLFFYLVSLLRIQALLERAEAVVADADWAQLAVLRRAILGSPNEARRLALRCRSVPACTAHAHVARAWR